MRCFVARVATATKRRLIRQAEQRNRSLCAEVVLLLLEGYQPEGWEKTAASVRAKTGLFNNRATAVDDGAPETVGIVLPAGLRAELEKAARAARRSLNSEIAKFLEEGKG